jgi:hypothetical protein
VVCLYTECHLHKTDEEYGVGLYCVRLTWVIESAGEFGSVDVFSFNRKFLKQISLRKEIVSAARFVANGSRAK